MILGKGDVIVTVATDALDRYHSVMDDMAERSARWTKRRRSGRVESIFHGMRTDWIGYEGTPEARERWHNLKYYTWVEQQGKTVEELDAQRDPQWWLAISSACRKSSPPGRIRKLANVTA